MGLGHWMMDTKTITSPVQAAELNSISPNQGTYLYFSLFLRVSIVTQHSHSLTVCLSISLFTGVEVAIV